MAVGSREGNGEGTACNKGNFFDFFLYYIALLALQSSFSFVRQSVAVTSLAGLITKSSNGCVVNVSAPFRTTHF